MSPIWLQLIVQYGIQTAYQIWKEWSQTTELTEEFWQRLIAIAEKKTVEYEAEAESVFQGLKK